MAKTAVNDGELDVEDDDCLNEGQSSQRLYVTALHFALLNRDAFTDIWQTLEIEPCLPEMEPPTAILWTAADVFVNRHHRLPSRAEYTDLVEEMADEGVDARLSIAELNDDDVEFMRQTIRDIWSTPPAEPDVLADTIRRHAQRRLANQQRQAIARCDTDPEHAMTAARQLMHRIESMEDFTLSADDGLMLNTTYAVTLADHACISSTGILWLDELLGGGHEAESVNAVVGAISSCKSTFCSQLALRYAQLLEREKRDGIVLIMSYEDRLREVRARIQAVATGIARSILRREPDRLTARQHGMLDKLDGLTRRRIAVADMTDPRHALLAGTMTNGVATICRRAHTDSQPIRLIVIDHASAMVSRYLAANAGQKDADEDVRRLLTTLPRELQDIARDYHCPVWITHQLSSEYGAKPSTEAPSLYGSAGSRSFCEYVDAAIGLSRASWHTPIKLSVAAPLKIRHEHGGQQIVVGLDGNIVDQVRNVVVRDQKLITRAGKSELKFALHKDGCYTILDESKPLPAQVMTAQQWFMRTVPGQDDDYPDGTTPPPTCPASNGQPRRRTAVRPGQAAEEHSKENPARAGTRIKLKSHPDRNAKR